MAPSLTATVDDVTKSVVLTVTGALGAIKVTAFVGSATPPATPANYVVRGSFINGRAVNDYDVPLNVDVVYIASDAGPPATQSPQVAVFVASTQSFLSVMSSPVKILPVVVISDENQTYEGRSTPHKILGSNVPLVTFEPPAYRSGTYTFQVPTSAEWEQVRAIILTGAVLLLRSPCPSEYPDTSFIISTARNDLRWNSRPPRQRLVQFDYQATGPDTAPPQAFAWTWADLPVAAATWADVPVNPAWATWADLAAYNPAGA